ncbi:unnamed protein product [Wuchereria bancrofti]|uniref:Uncharacterized protein n=1 Tax=Wuchereria bancrofti TaxID=6293 RepID=A0A3P7EE24_WUCBA|nr:unnamed protein product [Wuchereria bancrofti]
MRSWKTVVVSRGTCAMFGNRCCSLLHHRFPMEIISAILIILITISNGTQVEAIQFPNSFPSSLSSSSSSSSSLSSSSSTVISSSRYGSEDILAGLRIRRNADDYFIQRLRALRQGRKLDVNIVQNEDDIRSKQRFIENDISSIDRSIQNNDDRFLSHTITTTIATTTTTIVENKQQQPLLQQKSKLFQQTQNIALANSPSIPKLIPSKFPRLRNRQDCNGSDCLKNNDAISLYIPQDNSTNDGQLPPLLLLSNNPSNISQRNRNPQHGTTLKLSKLHTGIKVLESDVQQFQKPILLPPSSDASYHISQMNSRNHGEYGGVKLTEAGPIPPFAGGAELTDFIQPLDTTLQTHRIYENIIPNHILSNHLYGKNKHYLLSAPGNRSIYNDFHSVPLIPFNRKLEIYESVTSLPSNPSIHSTYSAQIINQPTLLSSSSLHYGSQYDLQSVSFNFNKINQFNYLYICFPFTH